MIFLSPARQKTKKEERIKIPSRKELITFLLASSLNKKKPHKNHLSHKK
jgi:hypothetical protein